MIIWPNMESVDKIQPDYLVSQNNAFIPTNTQHQHQIFPPGYRFCPYDHELIVHYLKKKVKNLPMPFDKIKDVTLYSYNPQHLAACYPMIGDKDWYFFTPRDRKYPNGNRPNRAACDGYWKASGKDKEIKHKQKLVGYKKTLVFYLGKPPSGDKTNWIMHEFKLNTPPVARKPEHGMRLDDWVLCRIYQKEDKSKKNEQEDENESGREKNDKLKKNEQDDENDLGRHSSTAKSDQGNIPHNFPHAVGNNITHMSRHAIRNPILGLVNTGNEFVQPPLSCHEIPQSANTYYLNAPMYSAHRHHQPVNVNFGALLEHHRVQSTEYFLNPILHQNPGALMLRHCQENSSADSLIASQNGVFGLEYFLSDNAHDNSSTLGGANPSLS